jgi:hypothetical protein
MLPARARSSSVRPSYLVFRLKLLKTQAFMENINISFYLVLLVASNVASMEILSNSAHAETSRERFECVAENNIIYTIFVNPRAYKRYPKVIKWEKRTRKINIDLCRGFYESMNLKLSEESLGYIIPGYDVGRKPVFCASSMEKSKPAKQIVCDRRDIIISLKDTDPNAALRKFYNAAFSRNYSDPLSQSNTGLKEDKFGEPYIDMAKAILDSIE